MSTHANRVKMTVTSVASAGTGTITLNADGTYSYSIDNTNAAVQALKAGDTLLDVFTYTVTDTRTSGPPNTQPLEPILFHVPFESHTPRSLRAIQLHVRQILISREKQGTPL